MRTEDIQIVMEVYRTNSISKAAEALNISPQGLGKALKKIEADWGCRLFDRSHLGVVPTPVCNKIYPQLAQILRQFESVRQTIDDFAYLNQDPVYFIGKDSILGMKIEAAIQKYNAATGNSIVLILFDGSDQETEAIFNEKEYAYRFCTKELIVHNDYALFPIATLHYHPVVSRRSSLCRRASITIEDFRDKILLVDNKEKPCYQYFAQCCKQAGFTLRTREAYDKYFLENLLAVDEDYVYLGQRADIKRIVSNAEDQYSLLSMEPTFETHLVIQSRSGSMDPRLLNLIRQSLASFSDRYLD